MNDRIVPPPVRQTAVHQRTRAARVRAQTTHVTELTEETAIGDVLLRTLIRNQLRLAARLMLFTAVPLVALPAFFVLVPGLGAQRLFGVGLVWLLLGGAVYPLLYVAARWYLRRAERNERDFVELVQRR
jgi:hypothetical protein